MAVIHVIAPGLQTTVQDRGRWGWQSRGVSVSGAMDPCAYRIGNALVGNSPGLAALEIAITGPELRFEEARMAAVTGAEFSITVDGEPAPMNTAFVVPAGSCLRFGHRARGARAYLAVAGGIDVPEVFGSRSTHVVSRMGGLNGRALMAGDRVPLGRVTTAAQVRRTFRLDPHRTARAGAARVRVLPDPHVRHFTADALETLQSAPYTIDSRSDRMGFRLQGSVLRHTNGADIVSDVTPIGTLQVPASGQPILLMADRQTTGGYARLATVISADIGVAAQLGPGDTIAFAVCTLAEAIAAHMAQEQSLAVMEAGARR